MAKKRIVQIEISEKLFTGATQLAASKSRTVAELLKRQLKKRVERFLERQPSVAPAKKDAPKTTVKAAVKPAKVVMPRRRKVADDGDDR
jgi:hypothetical protein